MPSSKSKSQTRVKICGISRNEDALWAAACGADAIGLVFYEKSSRAITPAQIKPITAGLNGFISRVALFVDPSVELVEEVIQSRQVSHLQFHGDESVEFCESFDMPYLKGISIPRDETQDGTPDETREEESGANNTETDEAVIESIINQVNNYPSAAMILLDTFVHGIPGGTGESFNWQIIQHLPIELQQKLVLAGGLDDSNVKQAIAATNPYAVDVSTGVESSPGQKSAEKVAQFCAAALNIV